MIPLQSVLLLAGVLFSLSVAGIFLNRKNVILLLMCIELMLLAVNFNFVACRCRGRPRCWCIRSSRRPDRATPESCCACSATD